MIQIPEIRVISKRVAGKVWAALVDLFLRSPKVGNVPAEIAPVVAPVEVAPAQPIDYPAPVADHSELGIPHGSPLKALIDQLDRIFPAPVIKPGVVLDDLQYRAGQRAVVDWLRMQQQRGRV